MLLCRSRPSLHILGRYSSCCQYVSCEPILPHSVSVFLSVSLSVSASVSFSVSVTLSVSLSLSLSLSLSRYLSCALSLPLALSVSLSLSLSFSLFLPPVLFWGNFQGFASHASWRNLDYSDYSCDNQWQEFPFSFFFFFLDFPQKTKEASLTIAYIISMGGVHRSHQTSPCASIGQVWCACWSSGGCFYGDNGAGRTPTPSTLTTRCTRRPRRTRSTSAPAMPAAMSIHRYDLPSPLTPWCYSFMAAFHGPLYNSVWQVQERYMVMQVIGVLYILINKWLQYQHLSVVLQSSIQRTLVRFDLSR